MGESQQEALMRKVAELTELTEAHCLKMAAQSKAIHAQSVAASE